MAGRQRRQRIFERRHPVHYLKDGTFKDHRKNAEPKTIGETLSQLAGNYVPVQGLNLKTAEIRKLNKAIDVLEGGSKDGYFAL